MIDKGCELRDEVNSGMQTDSKLRNEVMAMGFIYISIVWWRCDIAQPP